MKKKIGEEYENCMEDVYGNCKEEEQYKWNHMGLLEREGMAIVEQKTWKSCYEKKGKE